MDYVDVCWQCKAPWGCKVLWKANKSNSVKGLARVREKTVKLGKLSKIRGTNYSSPDTIVLCARSWQHKSGISHYSCPLCSFIAPPGPMTCLWRYPPSRLLPRGCGGLTVSTHSTGPSRRGCDSQSSGQLWSCSIVLAFISQDPPKRERDVCVKQLQQ